MAKRKELHTSEKLFPEESSSDEVRDSNRRNSQCFILDSSHVSLGARSPRH